MLLQQSIRTADGARDGDALPVEVAPVPLSHRTIGLNGTMELCRDYNINNLPESSGAQMSSPVDPLNRKAYLHRWERDEEDRNITYWFCELAKDAAHWDTLSSAENGRDILNIGVNIQSLKGGTHTLRNFEIEEFAPNHFVIYCHGPHIYRARGSASNAPA